MTANYVCLIFFFNSVHVSTTLSTDTCLLGFSCWSMLNAYKLVTCWCFMPWKYILEVCCKLNVENMIMMELLVLFLCGCLFCSTWAGTSYHQSTGSGLPSGPPGPQCPPEWFRAGQGGCPNRAVHWSLPWPPEPGSCRGSGTIPSPLPLPAHGHPWGFWGSWDGLWGSVHQPHGQPHDGPICQPHGRRAGLSACGRDRAANGRHGDESFWSAWGRARKHGDECQPYWIRYGTRCGLQACGWWHCFSL